MPKALDIIGKRYGRLIVLSSIAGSRKTGIGRRMVCRCDCGAEVVVGCAVLYNGHTTSCGCLKRDIVVAKNIRHGYARTPEYETWKHIKGRCHRPTDAAYKNYGARGIVVCDEWRNDFPAFLRDMGPRPESCEIDRIDNNGPYAPGNCRWVTRLVQASNKRNTRLLTHEGRTMCLGDWARHYGIPRATLAYRLRRGLTMTEATAPRT